VTRGKGFEQELQQLQEVVAELEAGELSLDDALKRFEQGVKHASRCRSLLQQAETRVELLLKERSGAFALEPLDADKDQ